MLLFPKIGDIAEKTEALKSLDDKTDGEQDAGVDEDRPVQEIESLCMNCEQSGITRLLLTTIPYFREVIVMSFRCEHCGWQNNEIQSAGSIREHGTVYTVRLLSLKDLDRQLVKSATCTVMIPEHELTIPPGKGQLTTVEGLLRDIVTDLEIGQPLRRIEAEEAYNKIQVILKSIKGILGDEDEEVANGTGKTADNHNKSSALAQALTVTLDDPSGNSFIEFEGSTSDPKWNLRTYTRTRQQNVELGLAHSDETADDKSEASRAKKVEDRQKAEDEMQSDGEIYTFSGSCSSCGASLDTLMKKVNIPYFKDVLIMSTNCEHCGYRDNEVKSGGAISEKGKRIILKVEDSEDLSRDILKSETCGLRIPEIDLLLQPGTLGGRFTTIEGLLDQVYEELSDKVFAGDSVAIDKNDFEQFLSKFKAVKSVEHPFTVILEDPLANSYVQNLYAPDPDPNMTTENFERSWVQNEELGLNDMKVENYET